MVVLHQLGSGAFILFNSFCWGWDLVRRFYLGGMGVWVLLSLFCKWMGKGNKLPEMEMLDVKLSRCPLQHRFCNGVNPK